MTLRVGIVGLGGMGTCHFNCYSGIKDAKLVAVCDIDKGKLAGKAVAEGNVEGMGGALNLKGLETYTDARKMFKNPDIDVIDITLPTYLHAKYAILALQAGKHVICEKPMARTSADAKKMIQAAKKADRMLFVAHCIRFWPAYAKTREIIQSGKYGRVMSANFQRLSSTPTWSWQNWLMDSKKSGDAALDLHIHDADFILHAFGKPKQVFASEGGFKAGRADHINASYIYEKGTNVTAEGAWEYAPGFGFGMLFTVTMEKATLVFVSNNGNLMLHPLKGKSKNIKLPAGDGYSHELTHFIKCIKTGTPSDIVTPESAMQSVKLIELERQAAKTKKAVPVRF